MLVVNLFGAPGSGKSTLALLVAGILKTRHPDLTVEAPNEIAKLIVYDEAHKALGCQLYIAGRQYWQIARCAGHADIVVCDSPVMMSPVYGTECDPPLPPEFTAVCKFYHDQHPSLNYFVERAHSFERKARVHDEEGAARLASKIREHLDKCGIDYHLAHSSEVRAHWIADEVAHHARNLKTKNGV